MELENTILSEAGGEMTQTMYAHVNKGIIIIIKKKIKLLKNIW
jgi:hypothetical protein